MYFARNTGSGPRGGTAAHTAAPSTNPARDRKPSPVAVLPRPQSAASALKAETPAPVTRSSSIRPAGSRATTKEPRRLDIVIPLEADLDGDPEHEDVLRLRAVDGSFERMLKASDDDVTKASDGPLLSYCFRAVPEGAYELAVQIGDIWLPIAPVQVAADAKAAEAIEAAALGRPANDDDDDAPTHDDAPRYEFQDFDHE